MNLSMLLRVVAILCFVLAIPAWPAATPIMITSGLAFWCGSTFA